MPNNSREIEYLEGLELGAALFNSSRYVRFYSQPPRSFREAPMVDLSDALANNGAVLEFKSLGSPVHVMFKAFVTGYNETFSCDWDTQQVYGRIDPLPMFRQTTRNITLSFAVPAATTSEGYENLNKVDKLRSLLYATYATSRNALSIRQSPLTRISFMNILSSKAKEEALTISRNSNESLPAYQARSRNANLRNRKYSTIFGDSLSAATNRGALCVINNLTINHNLDNPASGVFVSAKRLTPVDATATSETASSYSADYSFVIPKLIEIALEFTVIHEQFIGHNDDLTDIGLEENLVYRIDPEASASDQASAAAASADGDSVNVTSEDIDRAEDATQQALEDTRVSSTEQLNSPAAPEYQGPATMDWVDRMVTRYNEQHDMVLRDITGDYFLGPSVDNPDSETT